jgi:glycosyltransferase involved in cell wall biosynthesis
MFSAIGKTESAGGFRRRPGAETFDLAFICNSATENYSLARFLRQRGTVVLYVFHEPEPIWNWRLPRLEGWGKTGRFLVSSYCSIRTLREADGVIVCSSYARSLYERAYKRFNSNVTAMPLLFEDEIGDARFEQMRRTKTCLGFIGTACKAHGFADFIALAKYAVREGTSIPFIIATGVDLTAMLRADGELARSVREKKIEVHHGRELSNDEINEYYLRCFCVWNVYRRSTQSGVLPRAFMAGSPVLASRIGSFPEYVREGVTGEFVDSGEDPAAILAVAEKMRDRSVEYADRCRECFTDTFYYGANLNQVTEIIARSSARASRRAT